MKQKLLGPQALALLRALRRPLPAEEAESLRARCEAMTTSFASRPPPDQVNGAAFAEARLAASSSGQSPDARARYARANELVATWVRDGTSLDRSTLAALNGAVEGRGGPAALRRTHTTLDGNACPGPNAIEALLAPMFPAVVARSEAVHPIAGAGLLYQWLVTVHPFEDGNGRTARLAVDHHLGLAGLPPACIRATVTDFVAVHEVHGKNHGASPLHACEVILRGLDETARLLWP